jgi:hypothetical protein
MAPEEALEARPQSYGFIKSEKFLMQECFALRFL